MAVVKRIPDMTDDEIEAEIRERVRKVEAGGRLTERQHRRQGRLVHERSRRQRAAQRSTPQQSAE